LKEFENVQLQKTPINVTDKVRILGGPLMAYEGQVLSVKNNTVKVVLPSLGYMMFAEVEAANLEVVHKTIVHQAEMNFQLPLAR